MSGNIALFMDKLEEESKLKHSSIRNFCLIKSGKSIIEVDEGTESLETIIDFIGEIYNFMYDNYKSLLDWLATTEIVVDKVVYKTRQNNIRFLQTLYKNNKNLNKKVNFQEVKNFKIPVITGLKCNLTTYVKLLADTNYYNIVGEELLNLKNIATFMIENNGYTINPNGSHPLNIDSLMKRIKVNEGIVKEIKSKLSKITDGSSVVDIKPLNKLVNSLSDLEKVTYETIKVGRLYTVERIETLNKLYKETNEQVEKMLTLMETSEDNNLRHDGRVITVLSKYVHSVAELLSFTSMKYFYFSLLVDTEVAIHKAIQVYVEDKNPDTVANILDTFLTGIDNSISTITSIFSSERGNNE